MVDSIDKTQNLLKVYFYQSDIRLNKMSVVYNRWLFRSFREKQETVVWVILLAMDAPERRANVRVHVSKNLQEYNYPRGALIMVAGAGGGNFQNSN